MGPGRNSHPAGESPGIMVERKVWSWRGMKWPSGGPGGGLLWRRRKFNADNNAHLEALFDCFLAEDVGVEGEVITEDYSCRNRKMVL